MALIDEIVNINITRETVGLTRSAFGTIMIMGESSVIEKNDATGVKASTFKEGEVKEYTSLDAVAVDFAIDTGEYQRAKLIFTQDIKVSKILIARKAVATEDYTTTYGKVKLINDSFYAVMAIDAEDADLVTLATAIALDKRILAVGLDYDTSGSTTAANANGNKTIAALTATSNASFLSRTFVINTKSLAPYKDSNMLQPLEAAWLGRMLTTKPGSNTWSYKNLRSVTADEYTPADINALEDKKINYYTKLGGINNTLNGVMLDGEYIDTIVGLDWLDNLMQNNMLLLFQTSGKIPYTNNGIGLVENIVRASLDEAVSNGVINDDYIVTTPDSRNISKEDKAARKLKNVIFEATLTGAIQRVVINGTISI